MEEVFNKRIYGYTIGLLKFLSLLPRGLVTIEVVRQLIRSGTSIGANYFEAKGASSKKDYRNYFNHSLKSANESRFWLNVLGEASLVPKELHSNFQWIRKETEELANIFASSILTMKKKK